MTELQRAIQLRESGQFEEAQTLLLHLLDQDPLNPLLWYQCAWVHDAMGLEREAVPFYIKSLELGLQGEERQGAFLGLGSTYRTLGLYEESNRIFEEAIRQFPKHKEFLIFYAMVQYNLKEYSKAMEILLQQIAETSNDTGIQSYKKAILYYADKLDEQW
ncbi:tetratricopeptide repeat protein [Paenibacillus segetis]|uniref:Tetratrico peptide repeat group 5 domain-containing protein n=1 Tax=Paenibacillus segetis TaxID=1325360 RepID=A0ABQ1YHW8_9BACL|nr:tetratricopeptide repeat protein [Paenibacillus segetis]GGH26864.1 hypothetical protein GCM10008013_27940 [Paenibacillus segetis]